ncbi:MAG: HlyC/CorC family transporter [Candidatus Cloacimonetes bacterium]|nr:HlyC/CorC family transporter [Candidatus Cloacimonadota bacterium]
MEDITYYTIGFLLILSAFFSGSETAYFSLSKLHIKKLEKSNNDASKRIFRLLSKTRQLLITILIGNTLVNILASSLATLIAIDIASRFPLQYKNMIISAEILLMTVLLLVFGEITPKIIAFTNPVRFSKITSLPIEILKIILFPFVFMLDKLLSLITKKKDTHVNDNSSITSEDFHNFIKSKSQNHPLEENEKKIIDSIFRFSTTQVKEIIVPRVDIVGVEISETIDKAKKIITESGYSRIPVYHKRIDEIVGVLYAKDLLLNPDKKTIGSIMRKPFYVTENMKIQNLLNQFKSKKIQIAIVVDEYGGTSGLISLEDILEQLVGEIMDEYDDEMTSITKLNDRDYIVSGMINIPELNHQFNLNLNEEYENLAAFLFDSLNHVPQKNEKYSVENQVEFTITQIKRQRINYVKLHLLNENAEEE